LDYKTKKGPKNKKYSLILKDRVFVREKKFMW